MKLSVILPSNKSNTAIIRSLDSLIDRGLDGVEYLINLDNVSEKVFDLIVNKNYPNIKIFKTSGTLSEVLNYLVDNSVGEYIARADDDDIYLPGRLRFQINYLDTRRDIDVVGAGMYMQKDDKLQGLKLYPPTHAQICYASLFECHTFAHPLVMGKRSFFSDLKYKNVEAEDFNLWVRGICSGHKYANLEIPLMIYSLPNYNPEKERLMMESVNVSISKLLIRYYKICPERIDLFLNLFSQRNRHLKNNFILKEEDISYFVGQLNSFGHGINELNEVIKRYAPELGHYFGENL
jgi:glycosyltransferase involved in cell wall biosynthesis